MSTPLKTTLAKAIDASTGVLYVDGYVFNQDEWSEPSAPSRHDRGNITIDAWDEVVGDYDGGVPSFDLSQEIEIDGGDATVLSVTGEPYEFRFMVERELQQGDLT